MLLNAIAYGLFVCGGLLALLFSKKPNVSACIGAGTAILGAACGLIQTVIHIADSGTLSCGALFQLPVFIVAIAAAVHSLGYLKGHGFERVGVYFAFFNITVAAMTHVTLETDELMFLVAWEIMGLASFALVCFDYTTTQTRKSAWIYLLACQAGSAFLIALFGMEQAPLATFIIAAIGFGLKIGFPLLHVWLPEAHPAAPAPVSALMSGAMIPLGFLGILRFGITTPELLPTYGWTLLALGVIGALGGALFAIPQPNLKKLLAYSSIENMGVIAMGFGLAFLGASHDLKTMYVCGAAGAFLHIVNHALLKGGLFLGAGTVLKATHTLNMDTLGGLLKRAPKSSFLFILNAMGLGGLPPFNGFVSEFLIYMSALTAILNARTIDNDVFIAAIAAFIALAVTGGLATAGYAKAISAVFLGEPRSKHADDAQEQPATMLIPVVVLFCLSLLLVFIALPAFNGFIPSIPVAAAALDSKAPLAFNVTVCLGNVIAVSLVLLVTFATLAIIKIKTAPRTVRRAPTWDCGFAKPTARMEYTGTAFAQIITDFFDLLLRPRRIIQKPAELFPKALHYEESVQDIGIKRFWNPVFNAVQWVADKLHKLQSGSLHFYILVITLALVAMLFYGLVLVP